MLCCVNNDVMLVCRSYMRCRLSRTRSTPTSFTRSQNSKLSPEGLCMKVSTKLWSNLISILTTSNIGVTKLSINSKSTVCLLKWCKVLHTSQNMGAVSLKFKSSFLSTNYTRLGANLPPKTFSETAPRWLTLINNEMQIDAYWWSTVPSRTHC